MTLFTVILQDTGGSVPAGSVDSTISKIGSTPRTFFTICRSSVLGLTVSRFSIFKSTNGQLRRYRTLDFDFTAGSRSRRFSISSSLRGRRGGGKSGESETFRDFPFKCFVPDSHRSRWERSQNRMMIPAFSLELKRWQAAIRVAFASLTFSSSLANFKHFSRVWRSSSLIGPSMPWRTKFHFRRCMLVFKVCSVVASANCAMWLHMDGRMVVTRYSSLLDVKVRPFSTSSTLFLMSTSDLRVSLISVSWELTSSLMASLIAANMRGSRGASLLRVFSIQLAIKS